MNGPVEPHLESTALDCERLYVFAVDGRESLSRPFSFDVELVTVDGEPFDLETVIAAHVSLVPRREDAMR